MSATTDFVNTVSRNFVRGYAVGSENRRRKGQADVAAFDIDEYSAIPGEEDAPEDLAATPAAVEGQAMTSEAIPESTDNNIAESVNQDTTQPADALARPAYGEGGDAEAVNKLLSVDPGAIDEVPPTDGDNKQNAAMIQQQAVPKVRVVDWEKAKAAKADAYMRAGMHERAANIDQEFTDLKQRKHQEFATRALQLIETDPVKAATLMSMASQYTADGTMATYIPTPGGQIMEYSLDEGTGKPIGKGTPLDAQSLRKAIMMNADPVKFGYQQVENDWREERAKQKDKQWKMDYGQGVLEYLEKKKQFLDEMGYKYTKLEADKAIAAGRIAADAAEKSGYTPQQWDKKVQSMNDYFTAISEPTKFKNEFGPEYGFSMEGALDGSGMPDMLKLRTGAESFMGHNGHNRTMSPQVATELFLTVTTPEAKAKAGQDGRIDTTDGGKPIVKGRDGKWYYIPQYNNSPTPGARPAT